MFLPENHPMVSTNNWFFFTKWSISHLYVMYLMFKLKTPCLRSQTSRSTVSQMIWRPKRSCCSGLRGSPMAIRTSGVRTSPPAGGTASCLMPSFTNTSEWRIFWLSLFFPPFNHSRYNNHNKALCFSGFTQHPHLCILTVGIHVITFLLGTCRPFRLGIPVRGVGFGQISLLETSHTREEKYFTTYSSVIMYLLGRRVVFRYILIILVEFWCCSAGEYWGEKRCMTLSSKPLLLCGEEQKYLQGQVSVSVLFFVWFGDTWYCK